MNVCGSRCSNERKNHCRDLQRWGRNLISMIGLEEVTKRLSNKRHDCIIITSLISKTLATEKIENLFSKLEDWSPNESCPVCDGKRIPIADSENTLDEISSSEKNVIEDIGFNKRDTEITNSNSKISMNSIVTNRISLSGSESSNCSPSSIQNTNVFDLPQPLSLPSFPSYAPFTPIPEIANQFYMQNFLHWNLLRQKYALNHIASSNPAVSRPAFRTDTLQFLFGKENGSGLMGMLPNSNPNPMNNTQISSLLSSTNPFELPFRGIHQNSSSKFITTIQNNTAIETEELMNAEQPLDLSSKRVLQAATQCAASSVIKLRDEKRQKTVISLPRLISSSKSVSVLEQNDGEHNSAVQSLKTYTPVSVTTVSSTKRNYSQADLDAAVKDIRCGRLGTRRASVVYGVPRSTLRNKIYKLEAAEELNGVHSLYSTQLNICKRKRGGGAQSTIRKRDIKEALSDVRRLDEKDLLEPADQSLPSLDSEATINNPAISDLKKIIWSPFPRQLTTENATSISEETKEGSENIVESHAEWKRARPKRGQYRRYDKDALDEAVKSVKRGEMSVHRAGSFYGVPHSTLEYKVKERNLMRCKKRRKSHDDNLSDFGGSDNGRASVISISRVASPPPALHQAATAIISFLRDTNGSYIAYLAAHHDRSQISNSSFFRTPSGLS